MSQDSEDLAAGLEGLATRIEHGHGAEVLVAVDLQVHPDALDDLRLDPRATTAALVSAASSATPGSAGDVRPGEPAGVRRQGGRVVSASSAVHRTSGGDGRFTGAMRIADGDRATAASAARRAAALARSRGWVGDPVDYLLVSLVRGGTPVGTVSLDPWPWRRGPAGPDAEDFRVMLEGIDHDRAHSLRLARATKPDDGAWATMVSRPLARRLTPRVLRLGWTPNQVTLASFAIGLAAAAAFATGDRVLLVIGAVLLQLSLVVDCVDGDVARYRRSFSSTGAWLDASTDRLKEFACYGGLAWGAGTGRDAWLLAAAMLTLQTVRHTVDYTFTAVKDLRETVTAPVVPLDVLDDGTAALGDAGSRAVRASERSNRRPAVKWTKRVLHLGIGERWAVLSVLAALGRPVLALQVLLVLGLVSFVYTFAGRTLRTRAWPRLDPSAREREIVAEQADAGPLPAAVGALLAAGRSRFLWVRPAVIRLVEYAVVLGLVWAVDPDPVAAAFALLLVVASHHYDGLYRVLQRLRPPSRLTQLLGLGVPGRLLVVAALAAAGGSVLEGGLWLLAGALGILFLVVEPVSVLREVRRVPPGPGAGAGVDGG